MRLTSGIAENKCTLVVYTSQEALKYKSQKKLLSAAVISRNGNTSYCVECVATIVAFFLRAEGACRLALSTVSAGD